MLNQLPNIDVLPGCVCFFFVIGHLIVCAMLIGWFKFSDVLLTAYALSTDRTEHFYHLPDIFPSWINLFSNSHRAKPRHRSFHESTC